MSVKNILISQPDPGDKKSVYHRLTEKYGVQVDFRPFIEVVGVPAKDMRKQQLRILDHTAIILTSRNAIDHFFRIVDEMKVELPTTMKYFCVNEGVSLYIQKYTQLRKRKMFTGKGTEASFLELLKKHKALNFLFPCSNIRKDSIPNFMDENKINYTEAIMYHTVNADLSDLASVYFDILVFFSPQDISSLFANFPDFKQEDRAIAGWGKTTNLALEEYGLSNTIPAPSPEYPSMVAAIEHFILSKK
ncbi:MAG: uroporphyrinogen-III synthase [Bacteroidia bacterium]|nr:uroporphyrinogen-III synthase [Bacteroidia bacterium]NNJ56841.1 uroporphyrinogen-III synthase [Bacteroidia bacterium]